MPSLREGQRRKLLLTGWNKNFCYMLITFDCNNWWYFITTDLLMNTQAQLNLCRSCCSWEMLQIVSERNFFIKWPLSLELPYIKLHFKYVYIGLHLMFKTHCKIIDYIILKKTMKVDLLESNNHTGLTPQTIFEEYPSFISCIQSIAPIPMLISNQFG